MQHLRFAGLPFAAQALELEAILRADKVVWPAIELARKLDLRDWLIVSGAIYNTVWNHLTGRPHGYGIKDIDLFYCDASDTSWEAEDRIIRQAEPVFSSVSIPVEIRNQARVHLWYKDRFGADCPAFTSSAHSLEHFASTTHAVGVRYGEDDRIEIVAPFGLNPIFSFTLVPNRLKDNQRTHDAKGERAKGLWPEVTVEPW